MSDSVPLPTPTNALIAIERLREEVARLRSEQVSRDELVRTGLAATGVDGRLITASGLLAPVYTSIAGMDARVSGAAAAVERIETRTGQIGDGFEVMAQRLTRLDAEMRIAGTNRAGAEVKINAVAQAQQEVSSRIFANEERIEAVSQSVLRLFSQVQIDGGMLSEIGDGITATVEAISELRTKVEITEDKIELLSEDVTTLRADLTIAESSIEGLGGRVDAAGNAISDLSTRVTATEGELSVVSTDMTTLRSRLDAAEGGIQANSQATSQLATRVTSAEGTISSQSTQLTTLTSRLELAEEGITGAATTIDSLTATVTTQGQNITSQGARLSSVEGTINGTIANSLQSLSQQVTQNAQGISAQADALTQVRVETQAPFTSAFGWEFTANHRDFTAVGAVLGQWPITANDGASVVESNSNDPQFISPIFSLAGGVNPVIRAMIRRRSDSAWDGRVFWSNNNHGFSASFVAAASPPPVGEWTVVEWDMRENADYRSSPLNRLRFDFAAQSGAIVDVKWIAVGNYGQGRAAQVAETMRVSIDATNGRLNATYSLAVTNGNKVIGARFANDGVIGRLEFQGDAVAFLPPDGSARGLEIVPGATTIRQFGDGWQRISSAIPFGPDNLVYFFGPNVGEAAASKAIATKWEDANGNSYTGGLLSAGTLQTSQRFNWTGVPANGTVLGAISHNNSSGRSKSIVVAFDYGTAGVRSFSTRPEAQTFGNNYRGASGTIVWRLMRGGAELGRWTLSATSQAGEPEYLDTIPAQWQVFASHVLRNSVTLTDTFTGTGNIPYSIEIVSMTGTFKEQAGTVAITVVEQPN